MKVLVNEPLKKYTTVHIGGIAKTMYVPENTSELIDVVKRMQAGIHILGGGSNLLINEREFDEVINLREFDKTIEKIENGKYYIGASCRNQDVIRAINKDGYGGIEYLYSVPGLIGGAIVMNAGGGKSEGWSISDKLVSVTVLHDNKIEVISKANCGFSHRQSIFKNNTDYVVLGAEFQFDKGPVDDFIKKREDRILWCRQHQDNFKPNFGSVFCSSNARIMNLVRRVGLGNRNGVHFRKKQETGC